MKVKEGLGFTIASRNRKQSYKKSRKRSLIAKLAQALTQVTASQEKLWTE